MQGRALKRRAGHAGEPWEDARDRLQALPADATEAQVAHALEPIGLGGHGGYPSSLVGHEANRVLASRAPFYRKRDEESTTMRRRSYGPSTQRGKPSAQHPGRSQNAHQRSGHYLRTLVGGSSLPNTSRHKRSIRPKRWRR